MFRLILKLICVLPEFFVVVAGIILSGSGFVFMLRFRVVARIPVSRLILGSIGAVPVSIAVSISIGVHGKVRSQGLRGRSGEPLLHIVMALFGTVSVLRAAVRSLSSIIVSSTMCVVLFWPVDRS